MVIDAATRRQIGGLFECQDLGTFELRGLPARVPARQVLAENRTLGQLEALRSGATPLVGRDEEMELLLRRWAQAKAGNGRVVLISAVPGVGKSRLGEALAERITAEPHVRLRYFCSPHHQDSALYPVIAQMERAAGFKHEDDSSAPVARSTMSFASFGWRVMAYYLFWVDAAATPDFRPTHTPSPQSPDRSSEISTPW